MRIQCFERYRTVVLASLAVASNAACASTPGAQPTDMSAAQHEAIASSEQSSATGHAAQYSGAASRQTESCWDGTCWSDTANPTAQHMADAKKHQKMAADHRAASQALRDAEARACVGISEQDRDMSPFEHRADIVGIERPMDSKGTDYPRSGGGAEGAVITFRAMPGETAQWLQRVVDCHLARNAALGNNVPEMPSCPLVPKNTTALVRPTSTGFSVEVTSTNPESSREIWSRAQALAPSH